MPTHIKYLVIVIALVVGLGLIFLGPKSEDVSNSASFTSDTSVMVKDTTKMAESTRYLPYSAEALAQNANKKRVLFFYADWCPTCRPVDREFTQDPDKIPADVVVIRVNYNDTATDAEEKALAAKYGITYQHTFVQIDASGNIVTKWNGGGLSMLERSLK